MTEVILVLCLMCLCTAAPKSAFAQKAVVKPGTSGSNAGLKEVSADHRPKLSTGLPAEHPGDPRVKVVVPAQGQRFEPGDNVKIKVTIQAPLKANDIKVGVYGYGTLEGENYDGTAYDAHFQIPSSFAGRIVIVPEITDTNNQPINGVQTTIAVKPREAPASIRLSQAYFSRVLQADKTERIYAIGTYHYFGIPPTAVDRDITSSAAGTTYRSSEPSVVTVDPEGNCRIGKEGTAVITVENTGVRAFASFVVEDPAHHMPAQDISSQLSIHKSNFRRQRGSYGFWTDRMLDVQDVCITNTSQIPIIGPLYLIVTGLPKKVMTANTGTTTSTVCEAGCPYRRIKLPGDGLTLQPRETVNVSLEFDSPSRSDISYVPKILRSAIDPCRPPKTAQ